MKNKKISATMISVLLIFSLSTISAFAYSEKNIGNTGTAIACVTNSKSAYASTYYAPGSIYILRKVDATFYYVHNVTGARLSTRKTASGMQTSESRVTYVADGTFLSIVEVNSEHTVGSVVVRNVDTL